MNALYLFFARRNSKPLSMVRSTAWTILFTMLSLVSVCSAQQTKDKMTLVDMEFSATLRSDQSGCYWDIGFYWTCSNTGTQLTLGFIPDGIRFTRNGATGFGLPMIYQGAGAWSNAVLPINPSSFPLTNPPGWTSCEIVSTPPNSDPSVSYPCGSLPPNAIPPIAPGSTAPNVRIRIYIQPVAGQPQSIKLEALGTGTAAGYTPWQPIQTFQSPSIPWPTASISAANPSVCRGSGTVLTLNIDEPTSLGATQIQWYKYTFKNCDDKCPAPTTPLSPDWVPVNTLQPEVGYTQFATGPLNLPTCYIAHLTNGCFDFYSSPTTVQVCQPLSELSIAYAGEDLTVIHDVNHRCNEWNGKLKIANDSPCCNNTISWNLAINGVPQPPNSWPSGTGAPAGGFVSGIHLTWIPNDIGCCKKFVYTATVSNACGSKDISFTVVIDREPKSADANLTGNIWDGTLNPPTVTTPLTICDRQSAIIRANPTCSGSPCEGIQITRWYELKWTTPHPPSPIPSPSSTGWTPLPGTENSLVYYTNPLHHTGGEQSAWYRVGMTNGACSEEVLSDPFQVIVKPNLSVNLTANATSLCGTGGTVTLTATASYNPVTFVWMHDGSVISGQTGSTITVSQPGVYYVKASDGECGSATSHIITICGQPQLLVHGPCAICNNQMINLTAEVVSDPPGCVSGCNFQWQTSDGSIVGASNGATITVQSPGTYVVTALCGSCAVTRKVVVGHCPSPSVCDCSNGRWANNQVVLQWGPTATTSIQLTCGGQADITKGLSYQVLMPSYFCSLPTCTATYKYSVVDASSAPVASGTGNSFTLSFPNVGNYYVKVVAMCNGKPCDSCGFNLNVTEACNCNGNAWQKTEVSGPTVVAPIACGAPAFTVHIGSTYTFTPHYDCLPVSSSCATFTYDYYDAANTLIASMVTPVQQFQIKFIHAGDFTIRVTAHCGGMVCATDYGPCAIHVRVQ